MSQYMMLCPQEGTKGDFLRDLANLLLLVDCKQANRHMRAIVCWGHHQHALITSACLQTSVQGLVALAPCIRLTCFITTSCDVPVLKFG